MTAQLSIWETPSDYAGFDPVGDIGVCAKHRDSEVLDRSNYEVALARLLSASGLTIRDIADWDGDMDSRPAVYDWQASHWAVGWVRYLMVRSDAPQAVRDEAQAIADDLASYPILCEDAFSELEYDEVCAAWDDLSVRERAELIKDFGNGVSIFAARRAELPHDNSGMLYDRLRSY